MALRGLRFLRREAQLGNKVEETLHTVRAIGVLSIVLVMMGISAAPCVESAAPEPQLLAGEFWRTRMASAW
jgi:hypothetical protein